MYINTEIGGSGSHVGRQYHRNRSWKPPSAPIRIFQRNWSSGSCTNPSLIYGIFAVSTCPESGSFGFGCGMVLGKPSDPCQSLQRSPALRLLPLVQKTVQKYIIRSLSYRL